MRAGRRGFTGHLLSRLIRIASALAIGIVPFLVIVLFLLNHLIEAGEFRRLLIRELEESSQLKVSMGAVEMEFGGVTGISLHDFSLRDPVDSRPLVSAPKVVTRVALLPLWHWQIVVQELRFHQPALQVSRNEAGQVDLLEILSRVLFRKRGDFPFALDVKKISIDGGHVTFRDDYRQAASLVTELRQANLSLERVTQRGFLRRPSVGASDRGPTVETPALDYELGAVLGREGKSVAVASRGRIQFPEKTFELRRARLDAELRTSGWPAGLLQEYYQDILPVKSWSGNVSLRLSLSGTVAESMRAAGEAVLRDLKVNAEPILAGTVSPGNGRLEVDLEWQKKEIRLKRLQLSSEEILLAAQGSAVFNAENDPYLRLKISTPFLPLTVARTYLPPTFLGSSRWRSLAQSLNQGEIRLASLDLDGRLSEIRGLGQLSPEERVAFVAEVRDAAADPAGPEYLPLRNVSGLLTFEKGILYFKGFKGAYGRSRLDDVSGFLRGHAGGDLLELRARGELNVEELHQQLKPDLFPEPLVKAVGKPTEVSGKAAIDLSIRTDFGSRPQIQGQIGLAEAALQADHIALKDINGEINISPGEITTEKLTASFAGSPVTLRCLVRDYASEKSQLDLTVETPGVGAAEISRLLLHSGAVQEGTVRGWLRYQTSLSQDTDRKVSGVLELQGVQAQLTSFREPPRQIFGTIRLDEKTVDLQGMRAQVGNFGVEFSGRLNWTEKPRLVFMLNSPEMDIALLLPKETADKESWYDRFEASGKVSIGKGRFEGFEFANLRTDLFLERRLWRLENFTASASGGKVDGRASFMDWPKGLDYVLEPKIQNVPVQRLLGWFDTGTREITGSVNLEGKVESNGLSRAERKRNMTGHFNLEIQNGVGRRLTLLVRILNLMDLTRWFSFQLPDFNQQGIRFRRITGDFKIVKGVYSAENLLVDSDDISITGAGQYDAPNDVIDAVVALRPFPRMGSVVSYIPLIGPGIAGIKDSIMVASFRVQGPVEEAVITPAPLSTLSEFFYSALRIPQRILTLPGQGSN
ncbi:MAG: AsmA-like C-terminal domain-containing protein [Candidatus Binatia bacterium]